jgi:hypothetical protein
MTPGERITTRPMPQNRLCKLFVVKEICFSMSCPLAGRISRPGQAVFAGPYRLDFHTYAFMLGLEADHI